MFGTKKLVVGVVAQSAALAACGGAASISATPGAASGKSAVDPNGVLKYGQQQEGLSGIVVAGDPGVGLPAARRIRGSGPGARWVRARRAPGAARCVERLATY